MNLLIIFLSLLILAVVLILLLFFSKTKDSNGRQNNVLTLFFCAMAIWIIVSISHVTLDLYTSLYEITSKDSSGQTKLLPKVSGGSKTAGRTNRDYLDFILKGLMLTGIFYVLRRPEWTRMLTTGIAAFKKGKTNEYATEILIEHAIYNPSDRVWVEKMVAILGQRNSSPYVRRGLVPIAHKPNISPQEHAEH
jgi:hypothetical protein